MPEKEIVFVIDVDGTLTNGCVSYPSLERSFSLRDGHGINMLDDTNVLPMIMSGECDSSIISRADKLRIPYEVCVKNKYHELNIWLPKNMSRNGRYIAISDDIPDIPLLQNAIIAFCPNDAEPEVINAIKNHPHGHVLSRKGGNHCVREAIDYLLSNKYLQEKFNIKVAPQKEQH